MMIRMNGIYVRVKIGAIDMSIQLKWKGISYADGLEHEHVKGGGLYGS